MKISIKLLLLVFLIIISTLNVYALSSNMTGIVAGNKLHWYRFENDRADSGILGVTLASSVGTPAFTTPSFVNEGSYDLNSTSGGIYTTTDNGNGVNGSTAFTFGGYVNSTGFVNGGGYAITGYNQNGGGNAVAMNIIWTSATNNVFTINRNGNTTTIPFTLTNNQKTLLILTWNGSWFRYYKDGVEINNGTFTGPLGISSGLSNFHFDMNAEPTFVTYLQGHFDDWLVLNQSINQTQVLQWNESMSSVVVNTPTINFTTPPSPTNNSIYYQKNESLIINASITSGNFNITLKIYNSTGSIVYTNLTNNINSLYTTINTTALNLQIGVYYFNTTFLNNTYNNKSETRTFYIYNLTTNGIKTPSQGTNVSSKYYNITWNSTTITPIGTGVTIANYNISLRNSDGTLNRSINSTSNLFYNWNSYEQNLSIGLYKIRVQTIDSNSNSQYQENNFNLTTNTLLNITAKTISGATITTFSINAYNNLYNYNTTVSTTNEIANINHIRGLLNISIDADGYALSNNSIANLNVLTQNYSYQFTLYQTNTVNFTFYNQSENTLMTTNVSFDLIGSISSYTNLTSNGNIVIPLIVPDTYNMRYTAIGFTTRFYFLTVSNRSYQNLNLYLIENGLSSNISVYVVDEVLNAVPNALVKALKYDLATNTYILQEIGTTDSSGKVIMTLSKYNEYYKFVVEYPSGTVKLTTTPSYITTDSLTLQIIFDNPFGEEFFNYDGLTGTVSFNTLTNNFNYNYNDASGIGTNYCLYVYEGVNSSQRLMNSSCLTSATGTILLGVDNTAGKAYYGLATYFEDGVEKYFGSASYQFAKTLVINNYGLFLQILITLVVATTAIASPSLALILTPISLLFGRLMEFHQLSYSIIVVLTFLGMMIAYLISQRKN